MALTGVNDRWDGLAVIAGRATVRVTRRPRVTILATGDADLAERLKAFRAAQTDAVAERPS